MKYYFLILLFFLMGCRSKEVIIEVPIHDTIRIEKKYIVKDTVIDYKIQYQNVVSVDSSYLSTDLASSRASIDTNGLLHHSIQNNGKISSKIVYITNDSLVYRDKPVEIIKTVEVEKELNFIQKILIWVGGISLILLVLFIFKKFVLL